MKENNLNGITLVSQVRITESLVYNQLIYMYNKAAQVDEEKQACRVP